jgi:hypothetical protein
MTLKTTIAILTALIGLSISIPAFAKPNMSRIEQRAAIYLLKKAGAQSLNLQNRDIKPQHGACEQPSSGECVSFVAGAYASSDQRLKAARACAGNSGPECVKFVAGSYASFDQREDAAISCKNNLGDACVQFVAGGYASTDQRIQAGLACANADAECVKQVAGNYASTDQRIEAAKACGGN